MNRFRWHSDILSPLNSDVSLNDSSVHSSTSLTSTSRLANSFEVAENKFEEYEKDTELNSYYKNHKESSTANSHINDSKNQTLSDADKEAHGEPVDKLTQSIDEVFYQKVFFSSIISPLSNAKASTNSSNSDYSNLGEKDKSLITSKSKTSYDSLPDEKCAYQSKVSKMSKTKATKESSSVQPIKFPSTKEIKKTEAVSSKTEADKDNSNSKVNKSKKLKMKSVSTQTSYSLSDVAEPESKMCSKVSKLEKHKDSTSVENMSLSLDKNIQIIIGLELDNMRRFILDQNIVQQKELLKLKDMIQKQNEVNSYLFSVIEELLETNKKLISKHRNA